MILLPNGKIITGPEQFYRLAGQAGLKDNPTIQNLIRAVSITNDPSLAQKIGRCLSVMATEKMLRNIPFDDPNPALLYDQAQTNPILLGFLQGSKTLCPYSLDLLNQHALVLGATGTGKTNFLEGIARQAMKTIPVWIFDKDKRDYRHLIRLNPNVNVFDAQATFLFNPLQAYPPFFKPKHVIETFHMVFTKTNNLLDGSGSLLLHALHSIFEERGVFQGSENYPTLFDLLDKIKSYQLHGNSRRQTFRESLVTRLEAYLIANPQMYSYSKGFPIFELAKRSFVLEVKGLGEQHGRFVVTMLLHTLFNYFIGKGERGNALRLLAICDETKWLAPPGYSHNIGFSPLAYILAQCRSTGLGIIFADQIAQVENALFVQSRLKICFRLGSGEDIEKAGKAMGLSKAQAEYIHKLDTGEAIVRLPKLDPFLIKTPKLRLR